MDVLRSLSDIELTERLNHADKAAMGEIYLRYWGVLYDHCRKMLRDDAVAEDIVHDIFASLLINIKSLDIKIPIEFYLYRAVKNRVIKHFYRNKNRQKYIESLKGFYDRGEFVTDEIILERELKQNIEKAVANFPAKMREVYEMSRNNYLTRREIAEATHVTEGTVNTQLNRALKILRSKLTTLFF
jgi:RNA polymerase sigma-70 factor (ECF subfamily)